MQPSYPSTMAGFGRCVKRSRPAFPAGSSWRGPFCSIRACGWTRADRLPWSRNVPGKSRDGLPADGGQDPVYRRARSRPDMVVWLRAQPGCGNCGKMGLSRTEGKMWNMKAGERRAIPPAGGETCRRTGWTVPCRRRQRSGLVPKREDGRAARHWWGHRWPLCWARPIFSAADSTAFLSFVWSGPGCSGGRRPGCDAVPRSSCWDWPRSGA